MSDKVTLGKGVETLIGSIVPLGVLALVIWGIGSIFGVSFGIENEGVVKYDDCRTTVTLQSNSWERYFKKFTCEYDKTQSGKIISGVCVHTDNDSSLLATSSTCSTAYIYELKQDPAVCTDPKYPFLRYDDKCWTSPY